MSKQRSYCIFFCRFGRCNKNDKCPYIHDPDKVAVCTRFVRGTCKVTNCPFAHKLDPEKMPVCSYFLQGRCNLDPCPYRHVKVNPQAEICKHFLKGYCDKSDQCKLRHEYTCKKCVRVGGKVKECLRCLKKRREPVKKVPAKVKTVNVSNLEEQSIDDVLQSDIIPISHNLDDEDSSQFDDNNTFASFKAILSNDYDSDDSWEDLETNPNINSKKPSIRILPRFLLEAE